MKHTFPYYLIKNTSKPENGKSKKLIRSTASSAIITIKIARSKRIRNDLVSIPIHRENHTSPCLYSFFKGLKNVRSMSGSENNSKKAVFSEVKNPSMPRGASMYQNLRKITGNKKLLIRAVF
jgi:hypothetical protein